jgi:putative hemolysin
MELLILLFLFLLNGVFAMSEMAVVSSRKARLQQWADEGRTGAKMALNLANEPSHFLSTIQVGITVIGITSGAFGEATLTRRLSEWLSQWPAIDPYSDGLALTLVIAGITVASLFIGELVPKRLALLNPERVASIVAAPMRTVSMIAYPLVRALSAVTDGFLALLRLKPSEEPPVTEDEIKVLMEQGAEAGVFEEHEQVLVSRVFRLDELKVTGIMTPRSNIVCIDLDDPLKANLDRIVESNHSRFPVVRGGLDHIEGIVLAKALLADAAAGHAIEPSSHLENALYVPATLTVMEVVEEFKKHRQTMAIVVNEHGEPEGMVTLNDVMEALVGDIATVDDEAERDVIQREDGSWLMDGSITIDRFKDVLDIDEQLPEEEDGNYHTLAGFVMMQLGRVPQTSDHFEWQQFRIEVVDMDRNRVDKVLVTPLPKREEPDD